MVVTFLLLAWGFFELSGGREFTPPVPEEKPLNALMEDVARAERAAVARADTAPATALILGDALPAATQAPEAPQPITLAGLGTNAPLGAVLGDDTKLETTEEATPEVPRDLRAVTGSRVNMRQGPGTDFEVLAQLVRDDEAEVLEASGTGWVKIRAIESGQIGWMAERLLTALN